MRLRKRTHCYVQRPQVYAVGGCPDNPEHDFTWSEFEDRLWCFVCEKDFEPEHWGIFDGPIPMGSAELMGISFDRVNLKTEKIVKVPDSDDEKDWARFNRTWNKGRSKKGL